MPSLVTEDGILTETPAILAFIAQSYPKARLAPVDQPFAFARVQAFNSYLCSTVHVAHAHRMRGYRWADEHAALEAMKKKVPAYGAIRLAAHSRNAYRAPWPSLQGLSRVPRVGGNRAGQCFDGLAAHQA